MATLAGIKGRFILSINDHSDVHMIFAAFDQEPVRVRYTVGGTAHAKDAGELVISGGSTSGPRRDDASARPQPAAMVPGHRPYSALTGPLVADTFPQPPPHP